jgi:hypothetical protein
MANADASQPVADTVNEGAKEDDAEVPTTTRNLARSR